MKGHLTDQDMERISEFVSTPEYKRTPEILIPRKDD